MRAYKPWNAEESRKEEEAWQADHISRRPTWRKDYLNELKSLGLENPGPVEITIPVAPLPGGGGIGDSYRSRVEPIPFLEAKIVGVRFKSDKVPSGATIREVMLLTDGDIGRPPCIDAEINGVRLLLRWNGMRPRVQFTSVLTAEEVSLIQDFTGESKGDSPKEPSKRPPTRAELLRKVLSTYTGPYRKRDGLPWKRKVKKLTGFRSVTLAEIRKALI